MAGETNGNKKDRLDRIEETLELWMKENAQFREEHRQLLKAQVLLYDSVQKLTDSHAKLIDAHGELAEAQSATDRKLADLAEKHAELAEKHAELAEAQKNADERMAALIAVVDGIIRRPPA